MNKNSVNMDSSWKSTFTVLLIILLFAFGLRIWGIWFGLPHVFHDDEGNEVLRALQLGSGQFNFQRIDKGFYFYFLFIEYGFLYVALTLSDIVSSAVEFGEYFIRDPSAFYLIGRATTAVVGASTVFLVFSLGRRAYSSTAGLLSAGALAVNIMHAEHSHYVTVDVPLTFLTTAALYFAVRMTETRDSRYYWLAALMAAFATATKTPGILLLIPLLVAHVVVVRNDSEGGSRYIVNKALWQAAGIFLIAYIVTNPGIVFHFDGAVTRYIGKFVGDDAASTYIADEALDGRALFANINLFSFYLNSIIDSMTLPIFLVCIAGVAYAAWRREATDIVLLSFVVPMYVVLSLSNDPFQFFPRYILPVLPILTLLGGRIVADLVAEVSGRGRRLAVNFLLIGLTIWPVSQIVAANYILTQPDTRKIARVWVDEHIESGSKIFIEGTRTEPKQGTVPLLNSPENLRKAIERYRDTEPGKAKYFGMALKVQSGKSYDLLTVRPMQLKDLEYYKNIGVQYFVVRPELYAGSRVQFHWPRLIEALRADPDVSLIQRFDSEDHARPGPVIEIYRVDSNVEAGQDAEMTKGT